VKRVRVVLGQKQTNALISAALQGIEDLHDLGDPESRETARLADAALDRLVSAIWVAKS
jgi:hypothetical protein